MKDVLQKIAHQPRFVRLYVRYIAELFIFLTLYFSIFYFDAEPQLQNNKNLILIINIFVWNVSYYIFGLSRDRIRFLTINFISVIVKSASLLTGLIVLIFYIFQKNINIYEVFMFFVLYINAIIAQRLFARQVIRNRNSKSRKNIFLYGTKSETIDLYNAMAFGKKYNVVGLISESHSNAAKIISGLPVYNIKQVVSVAVEHGVNLIVLPNYETNNAELQDLLQHLSQAPISVLHAPSLDNAFDHELAGKTITPENLLRRSEVELYDLNLCSHVEGKVIMVTGAGGSIGSELSRQLLRSYPNKLILLDKSELALYKLEEDLKKIAAQYNVNVQIHYVLCSITNPSRLKEVFLLHQIDIVYHAAAYKHVPIIEKNVISGVENNVLGTLEVARKCHEFSISQLVLISTDKAVRPTNVMGASKRLAEISCLALLTDTDVKFSIVRFGNVLASSGSVVPKFRQQIADGGPLTVTHEEINRYFMTVPEAAHLVLKASELEGENEVFLLDMGEPVKILDLAKSMARLYGLHPVVVQGNNQREFQYDEIAIEITGLRPGEKLFEELLVDGDALATSHEKIFQAKDYIPVNFDLEKTVKYLKKFIDNHETAKIKNYLQQLPLGYEPSTTSKSKKITSDLNSNKSKMLVHNTMDKQKFLTKKSIKNTGTNRLFENIVLFLLHKYFLFTRGLTLGVRAAVLNEKGQILLVKHKYMKGWYFPGGGVDVGESLEVALYRELMEETGISKIKVHESHYFYFNREVSRRDHVAIFTATTEQAPSFTKNVEIEEAVFFDLANLPEDVDQSVLLHLERLYTKQRKGQKANLNVFKNLDRIYQ